MNIMRKNNYNMQYSNEDKKKPIITFIDDDGKVEVMSKLLPVFKERGLKAACAIITSLIDVKKNVFEGGRGKFLTSANLYELQDEGWEMLGHGSYYSSNMSDFINTEDLSEAINGKCKKVLENKGFKVCGFVYPQHKINNTIYEKVKEYYKFAFGGEDILNNDNTDKYKLNRISFGCYTGTNPTVLGNSEKKTLEYFKKCVDHCRENNNWLVFMLHCGDTVDRTVNSNNNEAISDILPHLLDYIIESDIEVVTPSDGFNRVFDNSINLDKDIVCDVTSQSDLFNSKFEKKLYAYNKSDIENEINRIKEIVRVSNYIEPLSIKLHSSSKVIAVGETLSINNIISPYNTTNKEVWWSSSNEEVALVTQKGIVIAKEVGKTKIKVTTVSKGIYANIRIKVVSDNNKVNKIREKEKKGRKKIVILIHKFNNNRYWNKITNIPNKINIEINVIKSRLIGYFN